MRSRMGRLGVIAVAAIVQLAALVLAHNLVYLARFGSRYGEALVHSGHGGSWQTAATTSLALGALAAVGAIGRLISLQLQLRRAAPPTNAPFLPVGRLVRTWLRVGPALAIATVVLLTVQENVEQAALLGTSSGLGILLTPEYAGGLWIALAVGLAVGLVVALFAWRLATLEARLRAARAAGVRLRPGRAPRPVTTVDRPTASVLGRRSALRAPPVALPV
jgi:hypothetical protein